MSNTGIHFNISERKVLLRIFDIIAVLLALNVIGHWFQFDYFSITKQNWIWAFVLILYLTVFATIFELYDLQKASRVESTVTNAILTASVTVLFYLLTPYYTPSLPENRLQILIFLATIALAIIIFRFLYIKLIASPRFYKRILIVGEVSNIQAIVKAFKNTDPNYKIVGFINCETQNEDSIKFKGLKEYNPTDIQEVIKKESISEVMVATYNPETITSEIYTDLLQLLDKGFPITEYTQVYEDMMQRVPVQFVGKDFYKFFPFSRNNQNKLYLTYRRTLDIVFSFLGIIIMIAFIPLVLLGNLLGNRGKLFYTQERVGKNGKPFNIIKFRTMVANAEKDGAVWAQKNDARITPFGMFLRRSRLDELPQFINILKNDMSVIGPRPERPVFVKELSEVIPFYETRHIIKPGLTGWAQVKVRYGSSIQDSLLKLQYDLYYIKHRGFFFDVNILIKTLSTVIFFRGQ